MTFQPAEHLFLFTLFNLIRPITRVVVVSAQSRHAYSDGVLCSGDDAVTSFGVVLKAEDELCQHLGIHLGQFDGPDSLYLFARGGREAATVPYLKVRYKRDGERPAGSEAADIGLVNPSASKVEAGRYLAYLRLQTCA